MRVPLSTAHRTLIILAVMVFLPLGCASTGSIAAEAQEGLASYMASSLDGNRTANGERYDEEAMTAAHRSLPFGTVVRVTNLQNKESIRVRINDRGPFVEERVIDLSRAAARELDFIDDGVVPVRVEVVERAE